MASDADDPMLLAKISLIKESTVWYTSIALNSRIIALKMKTGAAVTAITAKDYHQSWDEALQRSDQILRGQVILH